MKRILITNDDGIGAHGIRRLAAAARKYGEVWVVAPESERSAASHSITLRRPIEVTEYDFPVEGVKGYALNGTPGDCIRVGVMGILSERPDLVLSGINFGFNAGGDAQYSATVAGAMEAVYLGIPAVAFSEGTEQSAVITDMYLDEVLQEVIDTEHIPGKIVNVNFPDCSPEEFKGILRDRIPDSGGYYIDSYIPEETAPGKFLYHLEAEVNRKNDEGSDLRAIYDNYISIGILTNIS